MKARKTEILITRSMFEKIPRTVYEHEIPILKEVHGEANINKNDKKFTEYPVEEIDHAAEYNRLSQEYGMHPTIPMLTVQAVYGHERRRMIERENEYLYEGMDPTNIPAGDAAAGEPEEELKPLEERSIGEIRLFFDEINFPYYKGMSKEQLLTKYNKYLERKAAQEESEIDALEDREALELDTAMAAGGSTQEAPGQGRGILPPVKSKNGKKKASGKVKIGG